MLLPCTINCNVYEKENVKIFYFSFHFYSSSAGGGGRGDNVTDVVMIVSVGCYSCVLPMIMSLKYLFTPADLLVSISADAGNTCLVFVT